MSAARPSFVEHATDLLIAAGHDRERIRTERFGATGERKLNAAGELNRIFAMDITTAEGLPISLPQGYQANARRYEVGWRGSFAEKQVGPSSPECLALLRKLRARPTAPVQF